MKERLTPHHALAALARHESDLPFVELLAHGTLSVEIYRPVGQDLQTPHTRDEVYVVVSGVGEFVNGGQRGLQIRIAPATLVAAAGATTVPLIA